VSILLLWQPSDCVVLVLSVLFLILKINTTMMYFSVACVLCDVAFIYAKSANVGKMQTSRVCILRVFVLFDVCQPLCGLLADLDSSTHWRSDVDCGFTASNVDETNWLMLYNGWLCLWGVGAGASLVHREGSVLERDGHGAADNGHELGAVRRQTSQYRRDHIHRSIRSYYRRHHPQCSHRIRRDPLLPPARTGRPT